MLARVLFALGLLCSAAAAGSAEEVKLLALGLADHAVTQGELEQGAALSPPRFNTPAVAYVLLDGLAEGDEVEIALVKDGKALMHNKATADDAVPLLLQAGKTGVPAGGWPEGEYNAAVIVTRNGKPVLTQSSEPRPFE
ncbi:MAG TPA: hypothetical protein VNJ31_01155 [Methyloceanibacter sp.]|nr:hypothetical protein [Methyloceanibacter sp.]